VLRRISNTPTRGPDVTANPSFAFSTLHDAALQLRAAARDKQVGLHPLPYARFDPEGDRTWWLAPFTNNPAFENGKIVIEQPLGAFDNGVLIGLHVEKGVGPSAAPEFERHRTGGSLVMHDGWQWNAFMRGIASGAVDNDLLAAKAAAGDLPLRVLVVASTASLPKLETTDWRSDWPVERVWYDVQGPGLKRLGAEQADLLRLLGDDESMTSVAETISGIRDPDWQWVEILVGIPFARVPSGGLRASVVWQRACAPWLAWVK
jgi:hypothetical protein